MATVNIPSELEALLPRWPAIDFTSALNTSTLKGRSVLITGAANGIGLACAKALASHGALVTIADIQQAAGEAAVKDIKENGYIAQFVTCDVTSYDQQFAAFKAAIEFGGGSIDIVIPNAGVISERNLTVMAAESEPTLDKAPPAPGVQGIDINLKGVYYSTYLALHYFRLPPPGTAKPFKKTVILIASMAGYIGYPFSTTYSMTKFGVRGILHGIREQALAQGVRVNLVAPFYIKTAMTSDLATPELAESTAAVGFAPLEGVVDAVVRFSADEGLAGRAASILPQGSFDLGDDIWGTYAGPVVQKGIGEILAAMLERIKASS